MTIEITVFYVTHGNKQSAHQLIHHLLEAKLIACGNVIPAESAYEWQGTIEQEAEYITILKTLAVKKEVVLKAIDKFHPYDVPCILHWNVHSNIAYANWIQEQLKE